ncbi:MAG: protein-(glutamine-N5) methyltransferase, release factor-specific [Acidobacteria bacterium RIFCSPLOWO2_02_FULL_61_28]|nr:MAG: protein-(glutamine-N5) methyltransferase, release factor-specific [Acidobacteria bacterium RIFCSPLOWO2_02_FULL_61_28]
MRLKEALEQGVDLLEQGGVPSPRITAEVLLMHAARCDRAHLYAHPERELAEVEWIHYGRYLHERLQGKPTQYITGHQEFWGLDFLVNPSVLIPRPETELLVEATLTLARLQFPSGTELNIADVGTGSGCIAVALAKELPPARIYALDQSLEALETARRNAARLGVGQRISFLLSNLLEVGSGEVLPSLQMVVSNPPYVSERDRAGLMREVRDFEPAQALFAGESGSDVYARLIPQASRALCPGGYIALELGYDAQEKVGSLLSAEKWEDIEWQRDLAGIVRVVTARRRPTASAAPTAEAGSP